MARKPPKNFSTWNPLFATLPKGSHWYRSHRLANSPLYFGNNRNQRWDAPNGEYGVLYIAQDPECAFMESIGRAILKTRLVTESVLSLCGLSELTLNRDLRVIDLAASAGLTRVGAEGSISNGLGYRTAQAWSLAFHSHPAAPGGILYRSRHDPARQAVALFDRCQDAVQIVGMSQTWIRQPALLGRILDHYGFGIHP